MRPLDETRGSSDITDSIEQQLRALMSPLLRHQSPAIRGSEEMLQHFRYSTSNAVGDGGRQVYMGPHDIFSLSMASRHFISCRLVA